MMQKKKDAMHAYYRKHILEIAQKIYAKQGVEATSMDALAKACKLSKATIYQYYRSKDEIFYNIAYHHLQMLKDNLNNAIVDDFRQSYYNICAQLADFTQEHGTYFDILLRNISLKQSTEELAHILSNIAAINDDIETLMEQMLLDAVVRGEISENVSIKETVLFLWSSLCGICLMFSRKHDDIKRYTGRSYKDVLRYSFDRLLHSITN